jgi:two-component system sensor histidine kinase PilS (NtrC family)
MISWLFAARMGLAVVALLSAAVLWTQSPDISFIVAIVVLIAFTVTSYSWWLVWVRRAQTGMFFLIVQSVVDLGLVTTLVYFSGGGESPATALYVAFIAAYAVLMSPPVGFLVAILASTLYLAQVMWPNPRTPDLGVLGQIAVFLAVYGIISALGTRLRQAGAEQVSLESEIRRIRLEADEILHNIRSGVLTVDSSGRLAFINPMAAQLLQVDATAVGMPFLDSIKQRSTELWAALLDGTQTGRKVNRGEGLVTRRDGSRFPIGLTTTTFGRGPSEGQSVTALFTDISASKRLEALHRRAERLEAVAALSASLAHEIRNPLASIRSSVEQLAKTAHADEDDQVLADLIVRETDRLTRLLSEFLDFSRVRATQFLRLDVRTVVEAASRLIQAHPDVSEATITIEGDPTLVEGDEDLLHRVLANLLLNAAQAAAGPVNIRIGFGEARASELPMGSGIENPIRIRVEDDGPGIPSEVLDRIFQPFVTGRKGGTGLGLPIVQRAVEAHRGLVLVDTTAGAGTTFTIFLPAQHRMEDAA